MTKEEAVKEIEKAFEPAFANYIITALTEGATASDKEPFEPMVEIDLYSVIKQKYIEREVLDEIRAEIAEYGSIMVAYAITKNTKTDKGIEKLVRDVLKQAKKQVLAMIDKYKAESGEV